MNAEELKKYKMKRSSARESKNSIEDVEMANRFQEIKRQKR